MKFSIIQQAGFFYRRGLIFFSCFILVAAVGYSQTVIGTLQQQLENYSQNNLQEEMYIHTDKSVYVPGEVIWFKAYVVDTRFHHPLNLSKVAYVEILDNNNIPILQTKIQLKDGSGSGSFLLPVTINSGNFLFRGYTRWMKNAGPGFFFEKSITLINTLRNYSPAVASATGKYDVRFFPEGGNLVTGVESRVAFKIADQYGRGVNGIGILINDKNDTIARFNSSRFGIGSFNFTPATGQNYHAFVATKKDSLIPVTFPPIYEKGLVMRVADAGKQVTVTVSSDGQSAEQSIYLVAHNRQKNNFAAAQPLTNHGTVFTIDKDILGEGITTFTIFNQVRQPLCERLYFNKPARQELTVSPDGSSYAKRNRITLGIAGGADDMNDLSLSVYRTDSLQAPDPSSILSYLWFGADLRGMIESPEYYFSDSTGAEVAADNLMLTQGWRRFKWEDVFSGKNISKDLIPEYEGHLVGGKIVNKQSGKPVEGVIAYLSAPSKKYQFTTARSNAKGEILFNTKDFIGTEQIIAQTQNPDYRVDILNPFSEDYSTTVLPELSIPSSLGNPLLYHSINSQVQTTFVNDSMNTFYYPFADTLHFFGPPSATYYLDNYTRFTTMEEVLREYIPEIAPRRLRGKYQLYMLKNPHEFFNEDALVLIDGVPFFNMDSVLAVDPLKIQKIEVLPKKYIEGTLTAQGGITSYSTYKGNLEGIRLDPNALVMEYEGMQLQREFYSPLYETPAQKNSHTPDFRNLLYWSPSVKINRGDKKTISFYSSDLEGTYFIMLQGISANGKVLCKTAQFEVKK